jgi:hypothetical protein
MNKCPGNELINYQVEKVLAGVLLSNLTCALKFIWQAKHQFDGWSGKMSMIVSSLFFV